MPTIAQTSVYVHTQLISPDDTFLNTVLTPAGPVQKLDRTDWKGKYSALLERWNNSVSYIDWEKFELPSTLVITLGAAVDLAMLREAFNQIAPEATHKEFLASYTLPTWFPNGQYALAYLILCAQLRLTAAQVIREADRGSTKHLGELVNAAYANLDLSDKSTKFSPGNLSLHLLDSGTATPSAEPHTEPSVLWLAVEDRDRLDERIFHALIALLQEGRKENVRPGGAADRAEPEPQARNGALSEVGYSGLGKWLQEYPHIRPLNTFDSAIATGTDEAVDIIQPNFERIAQQVDDGIERVKYILSIATGVASFKIEGRPSYLTLLLTRTSTGDYDEKHMTELFRYEPGIPLQYRNREFRSAIESSPSPNFVLWASLRSMRVERCFSYHGGEKDVFRRQYFSRIADYCEGVVIHTHQSGSVEVYNKTGLCLLGHGIQWFQNPYKKLYDKCRDFFVGTRKKELAWRVCGIVANLVEQRASSILLFTKKGTKDKKGTIEKLETKEVPTLAGMQSCPLVDSDVLCVKEKFYFEDVCRFLQIDGAHAIAETGEVIRFGMKIRDAESKNKLGGTGKSATKTIAQAIHKEEEQGSTSFVVKVSGSGYYSLYQHGQQVPTPFDA